MTKNIENKYFDIRTRGRYLKSGEISQKDVDQYLKQLPNDEENFELVMIEEDDIGLGEQLSEEELKSMPSITEENINNFDFLEEEVSDTTQESPEEDNKE